jgi:hypothetical protein
VDDDPPLGARPRARTRSRALFGRVRHGFAGSQVRRWQAHRLAVGSAIKEGARGAQVGERPRETARRRATRVHGVPKSG